MGAATGAKPWNAGTGKGWRDRRGYKWIRVDGRSVREHRHIMEQKIGRRLLGDEIVHHLNGDVADNRPENLEIVRNGEHTRIHHVGERRPDMAKERIARAARDRERIKVLERSNADLLAALDETSATLTGVLAAIERDSGRGPEIIYAALDRARAALQSARGKG